MNNYNRETGPIPLSKKGIAAVQLHLRGDYVTGDGWFNSYGVFTTFSQEVIDSPISEYEGGLPYCHGLLHWSEKLLGLSPRSWRLTLSEGVLNVVSRRTGRIRIQIQPEDLRVVADSFSGWGVVGKSGYLVHGAPYSHHSVKEGNELDEVLDRANRGKRPRGGSVLDGSPYVKILDPQYTGRRVMQLMFWLGGLAENIEEREDGVVIDSDTKQLIAREYRHPLAIKTWGRFPYSKVMERYLRIKKSTLAL